MPHVKARDYGSLGFGYAYAYAEDQVCRFADILATVRRAALALLRRRTRATATRRPDEQPRLGLLLPAHQGLAAWSSGSSRRRYPHGPGKDVRATVRGFAAGWNAYLRRTGRDNLPDPRCRGAKWVKPMRPIDLYRRFYQLGLRASGAALLEGMVNAAPPGRRRRRPHAGRPLDDIGGMGSNGYAIGADGARDANALLLSNTHFPSGTDTRWYELHLTIPGKINAIGAALQGVPVVNVGFNRHIAWTHTVSTARRFAAYELKLAPGDPTSYLVGGRKVAMRKRTVRVGTRSHTFYETRWGPVVVRPDATLDWTARDGLRARRPQRARPPHHEPVGGLEPQRGRSRTGAARPRGSRATRGSTRSSPTTRATPTTATTARSRTSSRRSSSDCGAAKSPLLLSAAGIGVLDGSRKACRLPRDPGAAARGILGPKSLPHDRAARLHVQLQRLVLAAERRRSG